MSRQLKTSEWKNFPKTSTWNNHKCMTVSWIVTSVRQCAWTTWQSHRGLMSCSDSSAYWRVTKFRMRSGFCTHESTSWQPIKYCRTVRPPPKHKIKAKSIIQPPYRSSHSSRETCRRPGPANGPALATAARDALAVPSNGGTSDKPNHKQHSHRE